MQWCSLLTVREMLDQWAFPRHYSREAGSGDLDGQPVALICQTLDDFSQNH